jgi:hypothetical protein
MTKINTHQMFKTVSHEHLDDLVSWATGELPDSGLIIAECENGAWFIEQDYGHAFDCFPMISKPEIQPYLNPIFFATREEALTIALGLIKQVHRNIDETNIIEYFQQE